MRESLCCCYKKRMEWDVLQVSFGKKKQTKKCLTGFMDLQAIYEMYAHCWSVLGQIL